MKPLDRGIAWYFILQWYPLPTNKEKLLDRGQAIKDGVMYDHLMSVARKVNIPNIYIERFDNFRKSYRRRHTVEGRNKLYIDSTYLLGAICEHLQKSGHQSRVAHTLNSCTIKSKTVTKIRLLLSL